MRMRSVEAITHELCQNAAGRLRMNERDLQPEQPAARRLVDQLAPRQRAAGRAPRRDLRPRRRRDACPGLAWRGTLPTGVSGPSGCSSSIREAPTRSDAASTPWSSTVSRCSTVGAEQRGVPVDRGVEIVDRDPDVMDVARHSAGNATRMAGRRRARARRRRSRRSATRARRRRRARRAPRATASPSRAAPPRRGRAPAVLREQPLRLEVGVVGQAGLLGVAQPLRLLRQRVVVGAHRARR